MNKLIAFAALLTLTPGCSLFQGWTKQPDAPATKPFEAKPSEYDFADGRAPLDYAVAHWNTHQGDELRIDKAIWWGDQWSMVRTDAGIIVGRDVPIQVFTDDPAGADCAMSRCRLRQNEEGGGWSSGHLVCDRPSKATCESVKGLDGVIAYAAGSNAG